MAAVYDGVRDYRKELYTKFGKPYRYDDDAQSGPNYGTLIFDLPANKSGLSLEDTDSTVIHLVGNDAGATWPSVYGSLSATKVGSVTVGVETGFYPDGGFAGTGYRSAVSGFNPVGYYSIPYNAAIEVDALQDFNMVMVIKTGDFSKNETLFSKYVAASTNYNIKISINTSGTLTYLVGHDVTDASCSATLLKPYTYYMVYFGWSSAINRVYLNVNNSILAQGNGTGNIITDGTSSYRIGSDAGVFGDYALTTQIIEIWKQNTTLMTNSQWLDRLRRFMGIKPLVGIDPDYQSRGSLGTRLINNKLWQFGDNLFRINENGVKIEDNSENYVVNSTFRRSIATGWSVSSAGTTTVSIDTGGEEFSTVGGRRCVIATDALSSDGSLYQDVGSFSPGYLMVFSADYSVSNASAKAYWQAYNSVTTNWFNASLDAWQPTEVFNLMGSSTSRTRFVYAFENDSSGGNITITITNAEDADNASKSIYLYHVQFEQQTSVHERIITDTVTASFADDVWIYPNTWMNFSEGAMTFSLYPTTSDSYGIPSDRDVIGSSNLFMGTPSGGVGFRLIDGSGNQLNVSGGYQIDDEVDFIVRWKASDAMSIKSSKLGVDSSTAMGNAYSPGFTGLGQEGNVGAGVLNGGIKNLKIYGP